MARVCAVIAAGGSGERFGNPRGKQFVDLCGRPLVAWSLLAFDAAACVDAIVMVCPPERWDDAKALVGELGLRAPVAYAEAGETRQASVLAGVRARPADCELVAVHDGARPLITTDAIEHVVARLVGDPSLAGAIAAVPSVDTLKMVDASGVIEATPDRSRVWCAQTPQVFSVQVLLDAHTQAATEGFVGTDDASLVERAGGRVAVVDPGCENLKVTTPEDLPLAAAVLRSRGEHAPKSHVWK